MERRLDESAPPWRTLGAATRAGGPDAGRGSTADPDAPAPAGGAPLPLLVAGVLATVVLAVFAFAVALTSSDGANVALDGAVVIVGATDAAEPGVGTGPDLLVVDVGGAVANPGVYRVPAGSRVGDAIAAAGGYGPRVDAERASAELNLAAVIGDGDRVRVPSRDDPAAAVDGGGTSGGAGSGSGGPGAGGSGSGSGGLVDLNRASSAELEALPGIGPVLAGRIIASREEQPFRSVDELRERGILGEATFSKVRDLVDIR